jgi:hypothetical protein
LHKVRAHTGHDDEHSRGNAGADKLANLGAGKTEDDMSPIIKLSIPFANKDKAKELGARWDVNKKTWYVNTKFVNWEEVGEKLMALQEDKSEVKTEIKEDRQKKYIKISFVNKNKAKSLGARWDASVKSWYYIAEDVSQEKVDALLQLQ